MVWVIDKSGEEFNGLHRGVMNIGMQKDVMSDMLSVMRMSRAEERQ